MLHLRPHHLIDIIRNIGHDRPQIPHPYGHNQHLITNAILKGTENEIVFILEADDLCKPCIHLTKNGLCDDVLPQLEKVVFKQVYNDKLDRKLFEILELKKDTPMLLQHFLTILDENLEVLVPICMHPKESEIYRKEGLIKGLLKLLNNGSNH